jgi:glycosyltransferase involved in cell wall biosynthesis
MAQPRADNVLVAEREKLAIRHYWLPVEALYNWRVPAPSLSDPVAPEQCLSAVQPDLILFADSFPFANHAAKRVAAQMGIRYLVLVHCVQEIWADQYRIQLGELPKLYAAAKQVIAVSTENLGLLHSCFGLPADKGRVIYNGRSERFFAPRCELARAQARAALGIAADCIVVLTIGRFELVKGYQYLLAALPALRRSELWPSLELVWVGSGTLEDRLRGIAHLLGGNQIHLLTGHPDIPALLDAADLLVHPSAYEGMPLVVLEAMAKGVPVVATAVSGTPEALGDTGYLLDAPSDDPAFGEQLAAAICHLAGNSQRRRQLGKASKSRAMAHFTEQQMVDHYLALVRHTLVDLQ